MSYYGYWRPDLKRGERISVLLLGLFRPGLHVWSKYMRGMTIGRCRCLRCGVTVVWDERSGLPRSCEDTKKFLIVYGIIES